MEDKEQTKSCNKQENYSVSEEELMEIRQQSKYNKYNRATPDNNPFFESRNNPLSSKGN